MRIVLHVGLTKTATTFLQNNVFPRLDKTVVYNPADIFYFVNAIFSLGIRENRFIDEAVRLAETYASREDKRTLLLSAESFLQSTFDQNYEESIGLIRQIFPTAEVVLFLRNQLDWLESCYRESVKHGYHQSIQDFFGYENGEFVKTEARFNRNHMRHINIWKCNWTNLLASLRQAFDTRKVHLFCYEEFCAAPVSVAKGLFHVLGCSTFDVNTESRANKGLSAAAIAVILAHARALKALGVRYPTYDRKYSREKALVLEKPFHWRRRDRRPLSRMLRALIMEPYRAFRRLEPIRLIKRIDSKLFLKPGRLVEGDMRERLMRIYAKQNVAIAGEFKSAEIRAKYLYRQEHGNEYSAMADQLVLDPE